MDYVPDLMQKATSVINKVSYTKKDNIEKENEELENDLKKQTLNKVVSRKGKKQENTKIEIDYDEDGKSNIQKELLGAIGWPDWRGSCGYLQ